MRYLAIDLGDKRTGLAIGDDATRIASPVGVITTASPDERWRRIVYAVAEHRPDALVVGLPLNMDGTTGSAAKKVAAFVTQLQKQFGLPVHTVDERLTTYQANQLMSRSGLTHKKKRQRRDALAAATLLQDFFATARSA